MYALVTGIFWYISVNKYYIKQNYDIWTTTCNITMANVRTGIFWYISVNKYYIKQNYDIWTALV